MDIEGTLDRKTYSFDIDRGGVAAGEPIHSMVVRVTVDEDLVVREATFTSTSPTSYAATQTSTCQSLRASDRTRLARQRQKSWAGRMGVLIRDLIMGPVALTAYQSIIPWRNRKPSSRPTMNRPSSAPVTRMQPMDRSLKKSGLSIL